MSLPDLLRLAGAAARSIRAPALPTSGTSRVELRVVPEDLDIFGHVTNARYLSILNLGRGDWLIRTGLMKAAIQRRTPLLAGRIDVSYLAPLGLFQRFALETRALGWDDKWFFFEHRLESRAAPARMGEPPKPRARPVAIATVRALFRGSKGNVAPSEMLAAAGHHTPSPPLPDGLRTWAGAARVAEPA